MTRVFAGLLSFLLILLRIGVCPALAEEDIMTAILPSYKAFALKEAIVPETPVYPFGDNHDLSGSSDAIVSYDAWWDAKFAQQMAEVPNLDDLHSLTRESAGILLDNEHNINQFYSPVNLVLYRGLLNRLMKGANTSTTIDELYSALYWNDGQSICRPALSLWIDSDTRLSDGLIEELTSLYHTSIFQGVTESQAYNEALHDWLNEQTNDLVKGVADDFRLNSNYAISLCTSLYFRSSWSLPFSKKQTEIKSFHSYTGDVDAEFMHKSALGETVYQGSIFTSILMDLQYGGYVTFVLPGAENDVQAVLQSEDFFDFLFSGRSWDNGQSGRVNIAVPKVDMMCNVPLKELMVNLGITDAVDADTVALSNDITTAKGLNLSNVNQIARVIFNEDGIEAASVILSDSALAPAYSQEEINFILDRPFLFAVFTDTNIPLFIGAFYTP